MATGVRSGDINGRHDDARSYSTDALDPRIFGAKMREDELVAHPPPEAPTTHPSQVTTVAQHRGWRYQVRRHHHHHHHAARLLHQMRRCQPSSRRAGHPSLLPVADLAFEP